MRCVPMPLNVFIDCTHILLHLHVCLCVCVLACKSKCVKDECMDACMYTTCVYVCTYVYKHVCLYICVYVCMYVSMYVCMYVCWFVGIFLCMIAYMNAIRQHWCPYVYICEHLYICMIGFSAAFLNPPPCFITPSQRFSLSLFGQSNQPSFSRVEMMHARTYLLSLFIHFVLIVSCLFWDPPALPSHTPPLHSLPY